ncbi:putative major capsid protein [Acinetobacter phage DMU1]|nr:putative major capsid protein [Acinetobacter phage DMU1]
MALSDLQVFNDWAYKTMSEVLDQQVELFNGATRGAIILRSAGNTGDLSEAAFWAKIQGLVRPRDPYSNADVAAKDLRQLVDNTIKVASGTPPINIPPSMLRWIQKNPQEAGAVIGQQLAGDTMQDMLNNGLAAGKAAFTAGGAVHDISADGTGLMTQRAFNAAQRIFGDRSTDIQVWVSHSSPLFDLYDNALANAEQLYVFGTVNVRADAFGRPIIITDSPALVSGAAETLRHSTLGLTTGAILIEQNQDFDSTVVDGTGKQNITRQYQAEWSYNLGVNGYAYDIATGGKAPNPTALATAANWDKISTSIKDTGGVVLVTK